jgi:hypothetical protein
MGFLSRLFGKKSVPSSTTPASARPLVGHGTAQTTEEQAATRDRMEAERTAQRDRRPPASD